MVGETIGNGNRCTDMSENMGAGCQLCDIFSIFTQRFEKQDCYGA